MVFFACDGCGDSLKKNQVEKHTFRCRSQSFSCIDCQVCFTRHTYQTHIKCITENQKYGSKNYVEKEAKGELKQNAWCDQVERAIQFVKDPKLKDLLERIQGFGNIPRKEAKFINFLTNSCCIRDQSLCARAWKAIADEAEKLNKEKEAKKLESADSKSKNNGEVEKKTETVITEPKKKSTESDAASFKWKSTIKRKLKEAGGEMKIKKLRKVVLEAYSDVVGDVCDADELFDEKLKKAGVSVNGKVAILT